MSGRLCMRCQRLPVMPDSLVCVTCDSPHPMTRSRLTGPSAEFEELLSSLYLHAGRSAAAGVTTLPGWPGLDVPTVAATLASLFDAWQAIQFQGMLIADLPWDWGGLKRKPTVAVLRAGLPADRERVVALVGER